MKSAQEIEQGLTEKSDDELLAMLARPDDWQPNMVAAAKTQLERRGFEFIAAVPQVVANDPEFDELQRVAGRKSPSADRDIIFVAKPDVTFRNNGEGLAPKTLKVSFSMKDRKFSGVMPLEAFQRYEAWKIGIKTRP